MSMIDRDPAAQHTGGVPGGLTTFDGRRARASGENHEPRPRVRAWVDQHHPSADSLQPVQRRIVQLLASGTSDDRIADALGIGLRTVQRHVALLLETLGARSRFEAGVAAVRAGWLDPGDDEHQSQRWRPTRRPAGRDQTS
jgi:DNA-binding CsgD family transcriptional regulator